MRLRTLLADPAGNLTAFVLTPVHAARRAALASALMRICGAEQAAFIDEASLLSPLPRMEMMGGEFCGNATRAFGLYAARRRARGEKSLLVSVSGAREPVLVTLGPGRDEAAARMPLPLGEAEAAFMGRCAPIVRMEGISHAVLLDEAPSPALAEAALAAMPPDDAQGVLFVQGERMTPLVYVAATGTRVWESSCGSGSVALAWLLGKALPDGEHAFSFEEPGGRLHVTLRLQGGRAVSAQMGGRVTLGAEREIDVPEP